MKRRAERYGVCDNELRRSVGRWEIMTGWADDILEEEGEEDEGRSDGDILGDVQENGVKRRRKPDTEIPYEEQWETDLDTFQSGKVSKPVKSMSPAQTSYTSDVSISTKCTSTYRLGERYSALQLQSNRSVLVICPTLIRAHEQQWSLPPLTVPLRRGPHIPLHPPSQLSSELMPTTHVVSLCGEYS